MELELFSKFHFPADTRRLLLSLLSATKNQLIANPPETYNNLPMPIEKHFDIPFIATLALREKQIQQNYRPLIPC
jgi:hypothetical protein